MYAATVCCGENWNEFWQCFVLLFERLEYVETFVSIDSVTRTWLFKNRIPGCLYQIDLDSVLARQTSEKLSYKTGLDYL